MIAVAMSEGTGIERALSGLRRPPSVLGRGRERSLTRRQREILDELQALFFAHGFAELTMADLASRLRCSFRTLYAVAPSRDELVLVVVDRMLWRVGQAARAAIDPEMSALTAVRVYLTAATVAIGEWTEPFARDLARVRSAGDVADGHRQYLFQVTKALLDLSLERGEIVEIDTSAVARVLAGLGPLFSDPDVIGTLRGTPKRAADEVLEVMLRGLSSRV